MPNGRFLASMVYLPVSKLEGESGPRFLPVRGRAGRLWGPPYEQRLGGKALNPHTTTSAAPERYYWTGGWPTFAVLAKVGAHAACMAILILSLPDLIGGPRRRPRHPHFTENLKMGQPPFPIHIAELLPRFPPIRRERGKMGHPSFVGRLGFYPRPMER
jgi:hypothetical protein